MTTKTRPTFELGVRHYDNSGESGTIAGGENGMLREYGYRERARTYKEVLIGNHPEYTGVRFMRKAPLMLEAQVSSRTTIRKLRKKETRFHFWKNFFSVFNFLNGFNSFIVRINPFATYHAQVRWSPR